LQQPDDRRRGPSRPSLFSEEPPPAADSLGILSQLDSKAAVPVRLSARPRKPAKLFAALGFAGLVGGAGVWWATGTGDAEEVPKLSAIEPRAAAAPAIVPVAAPPATPRPAPTAPTPAATPAVDEREVSAATILDSTTAAAAPVATSSRARAADDRAGSLAQALETSDKVAKVEPEKHAAKEKHDDKPKESAKAKGHDDKARDTRHVAHRTTSTRRPAAEKDSDVALLEALLSHTRPAHDGANGKAQHATKGK
jgi:hypothetical protein